VLVDTRGVQRNLEAWVRQSKGRRAFKAEFMAPEQHSTGAFKTESRKKITDWLSIMGQRGWKMIGHPQVQGPLGIGLDLDSGLPLLDQRRYQVVAVFQYTRAPETKRIELPKSMVRQAQDHTLRVGAFEPGEVRSEWSK
tara:strand:- start:166 stop:582 length:417 start_codon:yes stop_codon:yes gene_type:complete